MDADRESNVYGIAETPKLLNGTVTCHIKEIEKTENGIRTPMCHQKILENRINISTSLLLISHITVYTSFCK